MASTKLGRYHEKRAPFATNEPFGDETERLGEVAGSGTESGAFVIHLHDATRRHYDIRVEVGGELLSFAVPKGPSLNPSDKVLAVKTEDHPLEYIEFEDVIPEGQYGAGSMIVWDRGLVTYVEGPAEDELAVGKLHVDFRGLKLRGRFAFVKLGARDPSKTTGNEWLLFKKPDDWASVERKITDELPRSVLSHLTVQELRERTRIEETRLAHAAAFGAKEDRAEIARLFARDGSCPLMQPSGDLDSTLTKRGVLYDVELDGVRVLATRDGDVVTLSRWGGAGEVEHIEAFYPDVVRALRALPVRRVALDGELVAFDATGHPNVALLAQRVARISKGETLRATITTPVVLVVKDMLALGELDVRPLAITARRELVAALLPSVGFLRAAEPLEGDEARVLSSAAALGITTVTVKAKGGAYDPSTKAWSTRSTGIAPRSRAAIDHRAVDPRTALRNVIVSNRSKIFWPAEGYTKGDLVDYYEAVADTLAVYLKNRPVILVRYPDGIEGKSFFQWNVPVGMPPWVRTMTMHEIEDYKAVPSVPSASPPRSSGRRAPPSSGTPSSKTPKRVFLVDDTSTLLYIANLGCIPLHVLASRAPDLTRADFLTIDFDVKQSELRHAVTLAKTLRELLDSIGLLGFPKTSGQTGLHVLVPLGRGQTFETARMLADLLGRLLVEAHPDIATMDRVVNRRGTKVYVDTGQTGTSRAIVAPYSVRAVAGATVSTPLDWSEVDVGLDPRDFTIKTVPERLRARGDLYDGLLTTEPNIASAVTRLGERALRGKA